MKKKLFTLRAAKNVKETETEPHNKKRKENTNRAKKQPVSILPDTSLAFELGCIFFPLQIKKELKRAG